MKKKTLVIIKCDLQEYELFEDCPRLLHPGIPGWYQACSRNLVNVDYTNLVIFTNQTGFID